VRGHLIINYQRMRLSIAVKIETIRSIGICLLGLDQLPHQLRTCTLPAEQVEDTRQIAELNVELGKTSHVHVVLPRIHSRPHPLEIEQDR
jgi:hypothetical protein